MTTGFRFVLILFLCSLACSCTSLPRKQSAAISKAFYAQQDALKAGRIDLAAKYGAQVQRLIPPPPKRQAIKPVESGGKRYVILPPEINGSPVLAIGSPALTSLTATDKPLQRQFAAEDKALTKTEAETDKVVSAEAKAVEKAETQALLASHSMWGRVKFYTSIVLIVGGIMALFIFFPAATPILLTVWHLFTGAISNLLSLIGGFITKWKRPDDTP